MYTCIWFLCPVSKLSIWTIMHPWKGLILEIIVWKTSCFRSACFQVIKHNIADFTILFFVVVVLFWRDILLDFLYIFTWIVMRFLCYNLNWLGKYMYVLWSIMRFYHFTLYNIVSMSYQLMLVESFVKIKKKKKNLSSKITTSFFKATCTIILSTGDCYKNRSC